MKKSRQLIVGVLATLLALASGIYIGLAPQGQPAQTLNVPPEAIKYFFSTNLKDHEGKLQKHERWRGKILIVNFWASWCPPCREEMPYFSRLNSKYAGNGVQFVGIALDSADNVSLYSKSNPMSYPLLIAENEGSELTRKLGNSRLALPYTLVLGRNAEPLLIRTGHLPEQELDTLLQKVSGG